MNESTQVEITVYKTHPSLSGYLIGSDGCVWSQAAKRFVGCRISKNYRGLNVGGRQYKIHRLVLETFVGPCPNGMESRHFNDIKHDNRLSNLRWGTHLENTDDSKRNGGNARRGGKGSKNGNARLTAAEVLEIRAAFAKESQAETAKRFGLSNGMVVKIQLGDAWKHLGPVAPIAERRAIQKTRTVHNVVSFKCSHCGATVTKNPSQAGRFCSRKCYQQWQIGKPKNARGTDCGETLIDCRCSQADARGTG